MRALERCQAESDSYRLPHWQRCDNHNHAPGFDEDAAVELAVACAWASRIGTMVPMPRIGLKYGCCIASSAVNLSW